MKAWKAHCGDDWAILVIAPSRREAMRQAFKGITGLISDIPYIDIRVKQMKKIWNGCWVMLIKKSWSVARPILTIARDLVKNAICGVCR